MRTSARTIISSTGALLVGVAALWGMNSEASSGPLAKLRPARDTTFLVAPLDDEGRVDYFAALNELYGRDVKPADNVLVGLWSVWRTKSYEQRPPEAYFEALGMPVPSREGVFLTEYFDYVRETLGPDIEITEPMIDEFVAATNEPWRARRYPAIAAWIESNEAPLKVAAAAVQRERYYRPLVIDPENDGLFLFAKHPRESRELLDLGELLACRAFLRIGEKQYAAAADDLLSCRRLARMVALGPTHDDAARSFLIDHTAVVAERALLRTSGPSAAELQRYLAGLAALPPLPNPVEVFNRADRYAYLDFVQRLREQDLKLLGKSLIMTDPARAARIDFEAVLRTGNRWFDRVVGARRRPDRAVRAAQLKTLREEMAACQAKFAERAKREELNVAQLDIDLITDDEISDFCLAGFFPDQGLATFGQYERQEQELDLSLLAVTLALHRAERGRYPERLEELAPLYLKSIPTDRYRRSPLVYKPQGDGYLLYSLGENGRDDGGVNKQDTEEMNDELDDRVVRVSTK